MKNNILVVSPHPDDETLGMGGTLLRKKFEGNNLAWLIITNVSEDYGWPKDFVNTRQKEIHNVANNYDFNKLYNLNHEPSKLDLVPKGKLVSEVSEVFKDFHPNEVYLPHPSDIHSDHSSTFDAVISCTKWFRHPYVKKVFLYETLSETEANINPSNPYMLNTYVDIEPYLEKKIEIMNIYKSEVGAFPFPRSDDAIVSLAKYRGSSSGFNAAESFQMLINRQ